MAPLDLDPQQPRLSSYQWTGRYSCWRATGCRTCAEDLGLLDVPEAERLAALGLR